MVFRANEDAQRLNEEVESYFLDRFRKDDSKTYESSRKKLRALMKDLGPAVSDYPSWHPLVAKHDIRYPVTKPGFDCGYEGLDHTRCFVNGFITAPYANGDEVIASVKKLPKYTEAFIRAEKLEFPLYIDGATAIVVFADWTKPLLKDGTIPLSLAIPLLLARELPCVSYAKFAESWEVMRPYFLGRPNGGRSSLFINQENGQKMKNVWNALIETGMFGPRRSAS
jgi:hypothetical protein